MVKEVNSYIKEASSNEEILQKMKDDTKKYDSFDVKRFEGVLAESYMMIPDSKARLTKSLNDLELFIDLNGKDEGVSSDEWFSVANGVLADGVPGEEKEKVKVVESTDVSGMAEDEAF